METYNNRITRATRLAPSTTKIANIKEIQAEDLSRGKRVAIKVDQKHFTPGTLVRHIINRATLAKALHQSGLKESMRLSGEWV